MSSQAGALGSALLRRQQFEELKNKLTISVLKRLLLFAGLRDNLNSSRIELAQILVVGVEHFHCQHEVLSLV